MSYRQNLLTIYSFGTFRKPHMWFIWDFAFGHYFGRYWELLGPIGRYLSAIGRYFDYFGEIWYHGRVPTEYIQPNQHRRPQKTTFQILDQTNIPTNILSSLQDIYKNTKTIIKNILNAYPNILKIRGRARAGSGPRGPGLGPGQAGLGIFY